MNRVTGHLAVLLALSLFAIPGAQASDIVCQTAPRTAPGGCQGPAASHQACARQTNNRPRAARLICDYTLLSIGYERIYAEQQRLLHAGAIRKADIVAWRKKRDACESVHCLDGVFAQWPQDDARPKSARDANRSGKQHEKLEAHNSPRRGEAARPMPLRQNPPAPSQPMAALHNAPPAMTATTTHASFLASPAVAAAPPLANKPASGPKGTLGNLAWFSAFGMSLAYLLKRGRDGRLRKVVAQCRSTPAPVLVLYALIVVNVLLLLFALAKG
ncbi:hypothetical protein [Cupriavidus basilensis]|uniref:hypothetical protein n=1 Tax=Cupriavidus basilensis TaxID=68895 RepID=UPI00284FFAC2|nr:hypothetical protein [Cupriavidus basilensis]MDR3382069.1 hypothetical protein [Cupriavidus basilensis]